MRSHASVEAVSEAKLLELWEHAVERPAPHRAEALERAAFGGHAEPRTLGERNARLTLLHARLFGRQLELTSRCPACDAVAQFSGDCELLGAAMQPRCENAGSHVVEACGHRVAFRLPAGADVDAAPEEPESFMRFVLDRCVLECTSNGEEVQLRQLPAGVVEALSSRMESLDPGGCPSFAVECPECGARWRAALDIGAVMWQKVRVAAERLLLDIDALARAYGWTERDVLRLTPMRRAAYLQMVGT